VDPPCSERLGYPIQGRRGLVGQRHSRQANRPQQNRDRDCQQSKRSSVHCVLPGPRDDRPCRPDLSGDTDIRLLPEASHGPTQRTKSRCAVTYRHRRSEMRHPLLWPPRWLDRRRLRDGLGDRGCGGRREVGGGAVVGGGDLVRTDGEQGGLVDRLAVLGSDGREWCPVVEERDRPA